MVTGRGLGSSVVVNISGSSVVIFVVNISVVELVSSAIISSSSLQERLSPAKM